MKAHKLEPRCQGHFVVKRFVTSPNAQPASVLSCCVAACASAGCPSLARRAPTPRCFSRRDRVLSAGPCRALRSCEPPVPASPVPPHGSRGDASVQSAFRVCCVYGTHDARVSARGIGKRVLFLNSGRIFLSRQKHTFPGFLSNRRVGVSVPFRWQVLACCVCPPRASGTRVPAGGAPGSVVGSGAEDQARREGGFLSLEG